MAYVLTENGLLSPSSTDVGDIYFGFALSAAMFCEGGNKISVAKHPYQKWDIEEVNAVLAEGKSCLNPSHKATIHALGKIGFNLGEIPKEPPIVKLGLGDLLIVFQVEGLPRLTDRHQYTDEEIASATIYICEFRISS
jgi:hypothetical protein